jgi:hypothetical protein
MVDGVDVRAIVLAWTVLAGLPLAVSLCWPLRAPGESAPPRSRRLAGLACVLVITGLGAGIAAQLGRLPFPAPITLCGGLFGVAALVAVITTRVLRAEARRSDHRCDTAGLPRRPHLLPAWMPLVSGAAIAGAEWMVVGPIVPGVWTRVWDWLAVASVAGGAVLGAVQVVRWWRAERAYDFEAAVHALTEKYPQL